MIIRWCFSWSVALFWCSAGPAMAQKETSIAEPNSQSITRSEPSLNRQKVIAQVGNQPITLADIDFQLGRIPTADGSETTTPRAILLTTIYIIAQQRRSLLTLEKSGNIVSPQDVDKWLEQNNPALEGQTGREIAKSIAKSAGIDESSFRQLLMWRISWQRYLAQHLTKENMQKHFDKQPSRFNGTRFRVEHLYITTIPGDSPERQKARSHLESIRSRLDSHQVTFAEAMKLTKSVFPSATKIDSSEVEPQWVSGTGPLHPILIDEIVKLQPNVVSSAIATPLGEHLLRVIQVEPGNRMLDDVVSDVRRHMLMYLLDYSANQSAVHLPLVIDASSLEQ